MSFRDDIAKFKANAEKAGERIFRGSCLSLFGKIVMRTPVDTGRLRGNWQVGVNVQPGGEVNEGLATNTLSKGNSTIRRAKLGDDVYVVNNLPYAEVMENGGSEQAPSGMVVVTVAEFQQVVRKESRNV